MLTLLCNVLFDTTLTDMETCYKVFTIDIADNCGCANLAGGST